MIWLRVALLDVDLIRQVDSEKKASKKMHVWLGWLGVHEDPGKCMEAFFRYRSACPCHPCREGS